MDSKEEILYSKIIGSGQPLLILHGFLGSSDNWLRLAKRWSQAGFEVHLLDLRNHGKSFWSDEFTLESLRDDLNRYIEYHQLNAPHLLGHSLGGKIIMCDAIENPENRGKYIVVDIAPKYYRPHHQFIFDAIKRIDIQRLNSRREAESMLQNALPDPLIAGFLLKSLKRTADGFRWSHNWDVLEENMEEVGRALPPFSQSDKPILFIKGGQSPYILQEDIPLIRAHFPLAEIISIPHAGHLVHLDAADDLFKVVFHFIKGKK